MPSILKKINASPLPFTMVHRETLVRRLNEAIAENMVPPCKLILLQAPAGYGKTTLLTDFAHQSPIPCCWYLLSRSDSEPLIFLQTLLASLRQRFPSFGESFVPLLNGPTAASAGSEYLRTILEALAEALAREIPERFALLLCGYHEVNEYDEVTSLIEYLVYHMPEQSILVLESREAPKLDFASLLAEQAMLGIGQDLLRFSSQEIGELVRVQGNQELSKEEAERLAVTFDGWITGLLMGTWLGGGEILQRDWSAPLPGQEHNPLGHAQMLSSYFVNEVFKRYQDMYAFLKEAVVLQEMHPTVCASLLGLTVNEVSQRLYTLEQHGLFVTHRGEGAELVYICHPVLRDLLYEELRLQAPERFAQLHQRAAELLSTEQSYKQVISHDETDQLASHLSLTKEGIEQGFVPLLYEPIETQRAWSATSAGNISVLVRVLFQQLRRRRFPLGLDDYLALRQALRAGFGLSSQEDLRDLCCSLWAKSFQEREVLASLFEQLQFPIWEMPELEESLVAPPPPEPETQLDEYQGVQAESSPTTQTYRNLPHVVVNVEQLSQRSFVFVPQFPITYREVAQTWRRLRRSVREGPRTELDIEATITNRCRSGVTSSVILRPRRRNRARSLLLVDRQGSMAPFHRLSEEVCSAIEQAGRLEQPAAFYYFHDVPAEGADETVSDLLEDSLFPTLDPILPNIQPLEEGYLYDEPELFSPQSLVDILQTHAVGANVVLLSDAGAARGRYDLLRLLDTIAFLKALRAYTDRYVWLNPLPRRYWETTTTTAAQIARHVPMFPLDREGLYRAVNVLRGQPCMIERPL